MTLKEYLEKFGSVDHSGNFRLVVEYVTNGWCNTILACTRCGRLHACQRHQTNEASRISFCVHIDCANDQRVPWSGSEPVDGFIEYVKISHRMKE